MNSYVELLSSLPHLSGPFRVARPPISEVQLRKRLSMLLPEDRLFMQRLWENVLWSNIPLATEDSVQALKFERLLQDVEGSEMYGWLQWRMGVRTVLAALRRRQAGLDAPTSTQGWGVGDMMHLILRNWQQPVFGLEGRLPWLDEARLFLEQGESLLLERCILQHVWHFYERCQPESDYGFASVFLYVSRWDICHRWSCYDNERGLERFNDLVTDALNTRGIDFEEWS